MRFAFLSSKRIPQVVFLLLGEILNKLIDDKICSLWAITNNPEYGNCFTFNANYNGNGVNEAREVTMTGGSAMLRVVLNLNQLSYTPLSLSQEAGARITIHGPNVFPLVEEYGINLKPNTASNIGIQQVLIYVEYSVIQIYQYVLSHQYTNM